MKDEDDNMYRPKENLSDFYENLKNKSTCTMNFDCKKKKMTISYPEWDYDYNCKNYVKFNIDGVIMLVSYDSCFEALCEFLKQYQFVMQ